MQHSSLDVSYLQWCSIRMTSCRSWEYPPWHHQQMPYHLAYSACASSAEDTASRAYILVLIYTRAQHLWHDLPDAALLAARAVLSLVLLRLNNRHPLNSQFSREGKDSCSAVSHATLLDNVSVVVCLQWILQLQGHGATALREQRVHRDSVLVYFRCDAIEGTNLESFQKLQQ